MLKLTEKFTEDNLPEPYQNFICITRNNELLVAMLDHDDEVVTAESVNDRGEIIWRYQPNFSRSAIVSWVYADDVIALKNDKAKQVLEALGLDCRKGNTVFRLEANGFVWNNRRWEYVDEISPKRIRAVNLLVNMGFTVAPEDAIWELEQRGFV